MAGFHCGSNKSSVSIRGMSWLGERVLNTVERASIQELIVSLCLSGFIGGDVRIDFIFRN